MNLIKNIFKETTTNIIASESLNAFPLRLGTRQGLTLLFNILLEVLASALR